MARILGFDLETTGLDKDTDEITEVGMVLWDTDTTTPLVIKDSLIATKKEISEIVTEKTGITTTLLDEFGEPLGIVMEQFLSLLLKADYVMSFNGRAFDTAFLYRAFKGTFGPKAVELFDSKPHIDLFLDIPNPSFAGRLSLKYLSFEHGFIPTFLHRAVFDVLAMLKASSSYSLDELLRRAASKEVICAARVSYDDRDKAKNKGFNWQSWGGKTYKGMWVRGIKEIDLESVRASCDFPISEL